MSKVLVTGGSGQLGKELKQIMPDAVYVSSKEYDLRNYQQTAKMIIEHEPDVIVHAAARVGGILDNLKYPVEYYADNVLMNTNIVDNAWEKGVKKFIGILSTCIYPDVVDHYPMKEDVLHDGRPTETNFSYGIAKRGMAVHIDNIRKFNDDYCYIIPCNLYGVYDKFDHRSHFVAALLKKIYDANQSGESQITLYGDGKPLRQFLNARDLALVIKMMIENDIYDNFNIATDENLSIDQISRIALDSLGLSHFEIGYDTTKPSGQYRKDVDTGKFKSLFPDFKFTPLEEGLVEVYNRLSSE